MNNEEKIHVVTLEKVEVESLNKPLRNVRMLVHEGLTYVSTWDLRNALGKPESHHYALKGLSPYIRQFRVAPTKKHKGVSALIMIQKRYMEQAIELMNNYTPKKYSPRKKREGITEETNQPLTQDVHRKGEDRFLSPHMISLDYSKADNKSAFTWSIVITLLEENNPTSVIEPLVGTPIGCKLVAAISACCNAVPRLEGGAKVTCIKLFVVDEGASEEERLAKLEEARVYERRVIINQGGHTYIITRDQIDPEGHIVCAIMHRAVHLESFPSYDIIKQITHYSRPVYNTDVATCKEDGAPRVSVRMYHYFTTLVKLYSELNEGDDCYTASGRFVLVKKADETPALVVATYPTREESMIAVSRHYEAVLGEDLIREGVFFDFKSLIKSVSSNTPQHLNHVIRWLQDYADCAIVPQLRKDGDIPELITTMTTALRKKDLSKAQVANIADAIVKLST